MPDLKALGLLPMAVALALTATSPVYSANWDVSLWGKPRAFTAHVEGLAEIVNAESQGEFQLTLHYGTLSTNRENLAGLSAGDFEAAEFCAAYNPDMNPTLTVMELPFLGMSTLDQELQVSRNLYQQVPWRVILPGRMFGF